MTNQKTILHGDQSGIGKIMDTTKMVRPSTKYKYRKKWQCKKCGHVFRANEAKKKYRNYAGLQLFDLACPECNATDLYSMIHQ